MVFIYGLEQDVVTSLTFDEVKQWFMVSNSSCKIFGLMLYTDVALTTIPSPSTHSVGLEPTSITLNHFPPVANTTYYLKAFLKSGNYGTKKIIFKVCGLETVNPNK